MQQRTVIRRHRFQLLLTDAERAELDRRAKAAGVDRAALIRAACFGHQPISEERVRAIVRDEIRAQLEGVDPKAAAWLRDRRRK
jgi:hypothetical protein